MSSSSYMHKRHTFGFRSILFEGMQQFHSVFTGLLQIKIKFGDNWLNFDWVMALFTYLLTWDTYDSCNSRFQIKMFLFFSLEESIHFDNVNGASKCFEKVTTASFLINPNPAQDFPRFDRTQQSQNLGSKIEMICFRAFGSERSCDSWPYAK